MFSLTAQKENPNLAEIFRFSLKLKMFLKLKYLILYWFYRRYRINSNMFFCQSKIVSRILVLITLMHDKNLPIISASFSELNYFTINLIANEVTIVNSSFPELTLISTDSTFLFWQKQRIHGNFKFFTQFQRFLWNLKIWNYTNFKSL